MVQIVVTGGAGFVGSFVVDELLEQGHRVRVIDALDPAAHDGPPPYANAAAEYLWADLNTAPANPGWFDGADAICHQAAKVGLGEDFSDVLDYTTANDQATASLLWALHRQDFRGRLVLASSMVVYGEGRYACTVHGQVRPHPRNPISLDAGRFEPPCPHCGRALEARPVTEDAPTDPRNVYAATKLHQEHLCTVFGRELSVPVTALRYHNVYGPRMPRDTPYAGVASVFRSACEAGRAAQVFEDGLQRRDFVHVRDVAHANVLALTAPEPTGGAFNIASGTPHTVGEMAVALQAAFGAAPRSQITGRYRLGDVRHVFAAVDRARRELGFAASVGFAEGMAEFATAALRRPPAGPGRTPCRVGEAGAGRIPRAGEAVPS